jgi:hypothetical protein
MALAGLPDLIIVFLVVSALIDILAKFVGMWARQFLFAAD